MSAAAMGLCSPVAGAAQNLPADGGNADTTGDAVASRGDIQDIVVTARRREESLQSVPVAIGAVTPEALEDKGVRTVEDLRMAVPGLNISAQRRDKASFFIRGQGPGIFNFCQRNFTSVATYFAEVPTEVAGSGTFYDLASVQVLKGPQGTLFGRNTTGGAVLFEPRRPTFDTEGHVKFGWGNYDYRDLEAVLNIPVVQDVLAIRLAANVVDREGYTTNIYTGQKLDGRSYRAYRISALFTPVEDFQNLTIIDRNDRDQSGTSALLRQFNPASPFAAAFLPLFEPQKALGIRKTLLPIPLYDRGYTFGITNKTVWDISDTVTLKNIASYRRSRTDRASDYDGTPIQTFLIGNVPPGREWMVGQEQYTEEFQIQGKVPAIDLTYILGFYHEVAKPGFPQGIRQSLFGTLTVRNLDAYDRSDALFAHAEWGLTDRLQLSGGFRYTGPGDARALACPIVLANAPNGCRRALV